MLSSHQVEREISALEKSGTNKSTRGKRNLHGKIHPNRVCACKCVRLCVCGVCV